MRPVAFTSRHDDFFKQTLIEKAPVIQRRQGIGQTLAFQSFKIAGIFQTNCDDGGQMFEKIGADPARKTLRIVAADVQTSDQAPLANQR